MPITMLQTVRSSDNNWLRYSIIGSKMVNMLEFTSQSIACDIQASQELWNAPSQVCSIAACGGAISQESPSNGHHYAANCLKIGQ